MLVSDAPPGGHMLVECDDPVTIHKFCSMLPAFVFEARPVITVEEGAQALCPWLAGPTANAAGPS
jgi:hypothetical protein